MSNCPYITLDIVPLMANQNSDYIEKYAEMISKLECNPNPYLRCGIGVMQYMKMYKQKVLTSGCLYYMNILAYIVDEISEKKSFKEIAQNVIKWAVCFIIDEVRKLLIFILQKIINNSFLSKFAKVFYNPDAPYGFYIVITPIFTTHLRSKVYNFFYRIYFKLVKKRTQRRRWRIPKESAKSEKKSKLNINEALKSVKSTLSDLAEAAFKSMIDSLLMAGDRLIDKAIKRYLGKIVKYDISGQYSNATPYSPYDRLTQGTIMIPDSANPVQFTNDFYYGLYSPSLFFTYSESAFAGVLESTIIDSAKRVLDFINPIGSTASKPPKDLKDKGKSKKEKKKEKREKRKEKRKEKREKRRKKKESKKTTRPPKSKFLSRFSKSSRSPAVLIFTSLSDMYSYYSLLMLDYEMGKSFNKEKLTYDINDNDVETIISYYEDIIDKNYFILKDEKNYFIDKTSDLFNNSVSLLLYANSTYYFSDDFMFLSFTQKLSMHDPNSRTEYLTPYYAVRAPIYQMMAWHVNDLSSEPRDDMYSIYMPYMLGLYLFNATSTDKGERGINFEDFINYVDSYIISNANNLVEAIELINRPVIEWYYDYLRYVTESKDDNAKIALKQISESIDYLSVNKPAYLAPVQHFVTEFREKYKKAISTTDQSLASKEYEEAIELGHNIMRLLNMVMLPVEGKVKDGLTQLVDWQVYSENIIYEKNVDSSKVDTTIHISHRAAERQLMVDVMRGTDGKDKAKIKSAVLSKLLNPVLAFIIQSKEILYNYFSHVDIGASTYAMVSLEPFSTYFDPLPARFTYDLFADPQMTNFLKRRGLDVFSEEDLSNLYYHSSISVFTDLLPVKTLSVTYDDLETESIDYGGYKIDIPIRWNVYTPEIRLEIYDNAYRDLYNYFFKYMKIAFYKGAARPPLDISFILDIITINLDHSVQNLVSYIVVPKSIDMEYIEYDSSEVYTETKTINITFSVIGFIHYTDTIETTLNVTGKGGISFLAGSFVEADIEDISQLDPLKKIYEYADTVITNWYGIYNAQPLYVLRNEGLSKTTITDYNYFSDGKAKSMSGMRHTYFTGNLYSMSKSHNNVYTINNTYTLPASHVYFKKKS
ncbi:MAG: hypothetical protein QXS19_07720 [Candidatus Methanomethylicia archaeon]